MERILLAMNKDSSKNSQVQIYIVGIGQSVQSAIIKLAEDLRRINIATEFDVIRRSLKAQLREANKIGAKYALLIGDQELKSKSVELKNLSSGDQEKVELNKIIEHMNSLSY